jgi:hypothetical protein
MNIKKILMMSVTPSLLFVVSGCSLPYFPSFSENSLSGQYIHSIPISAVVDQVKCEIRSFLAERESIKDSEQFRLEQRLKELTEKQAKKKLTDEEAKEIGKLPNDINLARINNNPFELANDNVSDIKLDLKTDELGNVTASAIDFKRMGLASIADLIGAKAPPRDLTPLFNASVQGRYVKTVSMTLNMLQSKPRGGQDHLCVQKDITAPNHLYIKEWLSAFMENINKQANEKDVTKDFPSVVLNQVTLTTEFDIIVDVTAGLNLFDFAKNVFIIPVQATPMVQFKPTFAHTLQVILRGNGPVFKAPSVIVADRRNQKRAAAKYREVPSPEVRPFDVNKYLLTK